MDPVTPPRWGEQAARHLPNSLHVIFPGAHGASGRCPTTIMQQFLAKGSVENIDTTCVKTMTLPSFELPKKDRVPSGKKEKEKR
jgi:hypothetical protein